MKKNYRLAVSNPCFELWLYLHLSEIKHHFSSCKDLKKLLKTILTSYNSSKLDLEQFRGKEQAAIDRAKRLNPNKDTRWPGTIGTHVYKVIESILNIGA